MFGLEGEFLKNPTDYRSYVVCIPILWCVMWWGLSAKQRDAPNPSGRQVSFMVYESWGGGRRREGRADWGNRGDGRWNRGGWKEERRRGVGEQKKGKRRGSGRERRIRVGGGEGKGRKENILNGGGVDI